MSHSNKIDERRKKPVRVPKRLPPMPDGLSVREKLLYVKIPLTASMLAELLGVSAESVYKAARAHRLPSLPRVAGLRFDGVEVAHRLFDPITMKQLSRSSNWKKVERKSIIKVVLG
jgi:hypothetical protein